MYPNDEIPYGLILSPTTEEFSDPRAYLERLDQDQSLSEYGLMKVYFFARLLFSLTITIDCTSKRLETKRRFSRK